MAAGTECETGAMVMKPVGCKNSTPEVPGPKQALNINNIKGAAGEDIVWSGWKHPVATMAKEMMEFTKNNIIAQAATAMLAQANQMPQQVLQLLR
ncbi:flagellin [Moorella thermoacetica]|nr:flagellin [Moorella thermoacetica]